jgi:hypothetical protein
MSSPQPMSSKSASVEITDEEINKIFDAFTRTKARSRDK